MAGLVFRLIWALIVATYRLLVWLIPAVLNLVWQLGRMCWWALRAMAERRRFTWALRRPFAEMGEVLTLITAQATEILARQPTDRGVAISLATVSPEQQRWQIEGMAGEGEPLLRQLLLDSLPYLAEAAGRDGVIKAALTLRLVPKDA